MAINRSEAAAAAALSPPMTSAFLNLSNYMYDAYNTPYSSTTLYNDIGFTPLLRRNGDAVVSIENATGLYAQAFVSTAPGPRQVIIAYEGTQLGGGTSLEDIDLFTQGKLFTPAQIADDLQLYAGQKADSLAGSVRFAREVINVAANQGIAKRNVYVTGHSLGAAEAQFAAAKTGLAGVTFAGPGLNTAFTGRHGGNVTNYVDAGDPIGNYAADGINVIAPVLTSTNIKHFGNVTVLPNASGQETLTQAAAAYATGDSQTQTGAIEIALDLNGKYHSLTTYASDLGVTLYTLDNTANSAFGFYPGGVGAASSPQPSVDTSWVAAGMTGGGVHQAASAAPSTNGASVLAAANDAQPAHALGLLAHRVG